MVGRFNLNIRDFMVWLLVAVFLTEGISILLTQFFHIPILRLGWFLLMLLIFFGMYLLLATIEGGIRGQAKIDSPYLILFVLVAGALTGLYYYLPQLIPQIFSITAPPAQSWLTSGSTAVFTGIFGGITGLPVIIGVIVAILFPILIIPVAVGIISYFLKSSPILAIILLLISIIWILKKTGRK